MKPTTEQLVTKVINAIGAIGVYNAGYISTQREILRDVIDASVIEMIAKTAVRVCTSEDIS